jgi:hypothetical protein
VGEGLIRGHASVRNQSEKSAGMSFYRGALRFHVRLKFFLYQTCYALIVL